ncbi:Intradiol ring-cleavage dioxygenase [Aspergillus karnatakaensis]|uniref:intradiol ring-cleavage dioxygenase n=1 Tax=Aspergillus karnatakaensis TaxID=1810916 RepID=UPI003CCDA2FD
MSSSYTTLPPMKDLTTENLTANVHLVNSQCPSPRLRYLLHTIVSHLHTFCLETRLSTAEWNAGIQFLTEIGQISDDLRHEFILLSDTLGVSALVDAINHPKDSNQNPGSRTEGGEGIKLKPTEGTVLGPFHTHDAQDFEHGAILHSDPDATKLLVLCTVKDTRGNPIENVKVDVWEGDSKGFYDVQNPDRSGPDGRGVLRSDAEGRFWFLGIVPVPYPIPMDGPVGRMLKALGRHPNRPGHVHFMLDREGWDLLITALYPRGDPYETSDPVFGVKESLVVDLSTVTDEDMARKYGVSVGTKLLEYDFVLLTDQEARELRKRNAIEAMEKRGRRVVFDNEGLPVPEGY